MELSFRTSLGSISTWMTGSSSNQSPASFTLGLSQTSWWKSSYICGFPTWLIIWITSEYLKEDKTNNTTRTSRITVQSCVQWCASKKWPAGISLVAQWLRLWASTASDREFHPWSGNEDPQVSHNIKSQMTVMGIQPQALSILLTRTETLSVTEKQQVPK